MILFGTRAGRAQGDDGPAFTSCFGARGCGSSRLERRGPDLGGTLNAEAQLLVEAFAGWARRGRPRRELPALRRLVVEYLARRIVDDAVAELCADLDDPRNTRVTLQDLLAPRWPS